MGRYARRIKGLFSGRLAGPAPRRGLGWLACAESLERRQPLAADFNPGTGLLQLTGSPQADKIEVRAGATPGTVLVRGVPGVAKNTTFSGVNAIVVNALAGNDDIRIGSNIRDVAGNLIGVQIDAGTGNDRVEGGDGPDQIMAGIGNDVVRSRGGDDVVHGGAGNDDLRGDDGDDTVYGDSGRDTLRGGNDDDALSGGNDDDSLFGDSGDDSLDGDAGRDRLFGGLGNDDDYDDDDDLRDREPEDEGENEGGGGDASGATTIVFTGGAATVTGTSAGKQDKKFYVFTAPTAGQLTVVLQAGTGGRFADLEIEDVLTSATLLELEPGEGAPTSGSATVVAGRQYRLRLRSPDLAPVSFTVQLTLASS